MKNYFILLSIIFQFIFFGNAISKTITGKIIDSHTDEPVEGAKIIIKGSTKIIRSDRNGFFKLYQDNTPFTISVNCLGYDEFNQEFSNSKDITIVLKPKPLQISNGITVTASRATISRSNIETSSPVDVIDSRTILKSGNSELSQVINNIIPSFNSGRQTFSDATDHIDPATLRSLGPDQVLVLINGKRRHNSALVNITPIIGKGSVGTDLNSIPIMAIDRIEILREGASAQYGSDAIAGVINIILKDANNSTNITFSSGQSTQGDGQNIHIGTNLGFNLFDKGFANITFEGRRREATNRANEYQGLIYRTEGQDGLSFEENFAIDNEIIANRGLSISDFNLIIGNSAQTNANFLLNSEINISEESSFYAFGGINYRESKSAGFYRFPNDPRNNQNIYPNGYLPFLSPKIFDKSLSIGFKKIINNWNLDISNTFGSNRIDYFVGNSLNKAWGNESPLNFYSGANIFNQNTVNFDLSRDFANYLNFKTFIISFGGEFRYENYQIIEGEESSWGTLPQFSDSSFQPGAQVFPGFRPENSINKYRHNAASYLELQSDITEKLLISVTGRFENYSDFGHTFTGKISSRYKFDELLLLRGTLSNGFRSPSLHQKYFSNVSTFFFDAGNGNLFPFDVATLNNESRFAKALGINNLQEETSVNYSLGLTSKITKNTTLTVDAYQIEIDDRIVLSGYFVPAFDPELAELLVGINEADAAQFFSNAVNTRTKGIDIVLSHSIYFQNLILGMTTAMNFNSTEIIGNIKAPANLNSESQLNTLFNREERARLTMGQPQNKINIAVNLDYKSFGINLGTIRFGEVGVREATADPETGVNLLDQNYSAKWITNFSISYKFFRQFSLQLGANNIFDVYPDENKVEKQDYGRFPYNTAVTQFGFMGTYIYAGLNLNL